MSDVVYKAFAGIRNTLPPERLDVSDLVQADNVDIDESGRVSRRAGQTLKVAGACHSLWSDGDTCLYVDAAGAMRRLHADFSTEVVALGLSAVPMNYVQVAGRVYHTNGKATGVFEQGYVRAWGMPIDAIVVRAAATTGSLPAGVYQYAMTWRTHDGRESGCGLATPITLSSNAGLLFGWDIPHDLDIAEALIYLTQPDGEILLLAVEVDAARGHTVYTGGQRSLALATQWMDAPPAGQCLAYFKGRIYIGVGAFVFATTAQGYEWVDLQDFLSVDNSLITMIAPLDAGLLVGTEKGSYFLSGNGLAEFTMVPALPGGVLAHSLVMCDGQDVTGNVNLAGKPTALFATTNGICIAHSDGSVSNLTSSRYDFNPKGMAAAGFRNDATLKQYMLFLET